MDYGFVSHDDFIKYGKEFAARCRANHNCAGSLGQEVARMSQKLTPPDAAKKINGVGYIALSSPNFWGYPVGDYVVNYKTRQGESWLVVVCSGRVLNTTAWLYGDLCA